MMRHFTQGARRNAETRVPGRRCDVENTQGGHA